MRINPIMHMLLVAVLSAGTGAAGGYAIARGSQESSAESIGLPVYHLYHLGSASPPGLIEYPGCQSNYDPSVYSANPKYILRTDHGFVTVFYIQDGQDQPLTLKERTRTPVSALSPEERKRLSDGIYIYTEEQLVRLLQDYGS